MTDRRIADIEVLRGIAVLMVLVEHVGYNLFAWKSWIEQFSDGYWRGAAGVDVFFAVSGFVIARGLLPALAQQPTPQARAGILLGFALRRFWRLQPAAWVWIAVPLLLTLLLGASNPDSWVHRLPPGIAGLQSMHENLPSCAAGLLAIANLRTGIMAENPGICFHYWSLSLEEQFYLFLPVLALLFKRRLPIVLLACIAWQFWSPPIAVDNLTRPGSIAAGVLLAIWSEGATSRLAEPRFLAHAGARWGFLFAMILITGALQSTLLHPLYSVLWGLVAVFSAALVHAASFDRGYIMAPGLVQRVLSWIGARSYALYLCHVAAFALTRELYALVHPEAAPPVTLTLELHFLIVGFGLTFAMAELTYRFIEKPGRAYGRRISSAG